ncbi:MAG: hypothetical protein ETSY2_17945 [Candidatus Entotheonella gemina]|uniref:Uncharacterized protein n=1 Tax=Candidatus Entotheonella gemina TaxID=1429439 RepID=W4M7Z4_9BACT|nr:MAG: hypothetical protein ETSY2_17945 [Candidatus Entotheonella gemina]
MFFSFTLLLDSGVLCVDIARGSQLIFNTLEKYGLREGEDDKNRMVQHRALHDPEIQQEPHR